MSYGLHGSPEAIFYQYHLVGGPHDGEISNGFKPYFCLRLPDGCVYEVPGGLTNESDFAEWLDDGTRKINLAFKEKGAPPQLTEEERKLCAALEPKPREIDDKTGLYSFYDPHPGLMGCMVSIPEKVRLVANSLAQQDATGRVTPHTLPEAAEMIQKAYPQGVVTVHEDHRWIGLHVHTPDGCTHSWRVIRFVKDEKDVSNL